ncbi:MAG: hypothetical protein IKW03_09075 [Clostridia bacterium]|nr:hypothetical protein [Clostridia bacterium]
MTAKDFVMLNARRSKTACYCSNQDDEYSIYNAVDEAVNEGYEFFLFCAESVDGLKFAQQVFLRKKKQSGNKPDKIILVAVVSDERFTDNKNEEFRNEFFQVVEKSDFFVDLKSEDLRCCEKFIISKSSKII